MRDWPKRALIAMVRRLPRWVVGTGVRLFKRNHVIGVVCVAFDGEDRVLLHHHTYYTPEWRLPGGLRDGRESVFDTAVREVWEESRCKVMPLAVVDAVEADLTFDIFVLAKVVEQQPFVQNAEVDARIFAALGELPALTPIHRAAVQRAAALRDQLFPSPS